MGTAVTTSTEADRYAEYEDLLMERDRVKKEAGMYMTLYIHEFGELMSDLFALKIDCISKKRAIALCQQAENHGLCMNAEELQEFLQKELQDYYEKLHKMTEENERCKELETSTDYDVERAKKIYRRIARRIHPDIYPETAQNEALLELWMRTVAAYHANNVRELTEIEVVIAKTLEILGLPGAGETVEVPDLEDRIQEIQAEIKRIISTDPYCYQELLHDSAAVEEKKRGLQTEQEEFRKYAADLQAVLDGFAERGVLVE